MNLKNKIKVVLAEDEEILRAAIIAKIQEIDSDFQVVAQAANGEEALEAVRVNMPDVLFTDIKMPKMDGIETIQQVKRCYPSVKAVILSGYSDFSYMQQAIRYGVSNYLLKPIGEQELREVLASLKEELFSSRVYHNRSMLYSENYTPEAVKNNTQYLFLICAGNLCGNSREPRFLQKMDPGFERLDWNEFLKTILPAQVPWCLVDEEDCNQKILCSLMPLVDLDGLAQKLQTALQKLLHNRPVSICFSRQPCRQNEIDLVGQRLRHMLHQRLIPTVGRVFVLERDEVPDRDNIMEFIQMRVDDQLREAVRTNNTDAAQQELHNILSFPVKKEIPQRDLQKLLSYIVRMMESLSHKDLLSVLVNAYHCVSLADDKAQMVEDLVHIMLQPFGETASEENLSLPEQLCHYLDEHYLELDNLEKITEVFHYSYAYLTRVFKKETGKAMSQYIQDKRIELAVALMQQNPEDSIKHIADISGFGDRRYFQRAFKLHMHKTPQEFRADLLNQRK